VDEDFRAPLPEFVRRLRNYVLHYRLPLATMTVHIDKPGELLLKIDQLRERTGWTPLALEYLDALGDREPFETHVTEYEKVTEGFYAWFNSRIAEIHRKELDEYWHLRERIEELRQLNRQ
jgi:hypothetical protein